jgi:nicotinate-nucleotide adenylyltransferase
MERFSLDRIHFIPSRHPPHKNLPRVTPFVHRLRMLEMSISGDDRFSVLDVEPATGPSYTVNLVERLSVHAQGRPCLILGMDSLAEMRLWREPGRILREADVVVGTRPGFSAAGVPGEWLSGVRLFEFPGVCLSSSEIRERVSGGRSIRYLVTEEVRSYIREKGLYGSGQGN